jgi:iron-sulfur cluster assembly protein
MLEITDLATEKLKEYLAEKNLTGPVRVTVMRGCGGPSLGLALDDRKDSDTVVDLADLQVIMDKTLFGECGRTRVDFKLPSGCGYGGGGFVITSETPLPGGGGGCGGSCSSGGCGG